MTIMSKPDSHLDKTLTCLFYLGKSIGSMKLPATLQNRTSEILTEAGQYDFASAYLLATFPSLCIIDHLVDEQPFWCTLNFEGKQRVRAHFGLEPVDVAPWIVDKAEIALKAVQSPPTNVKLSEWPEKTLQHAKTICENIKTWPETYQLAKTQCEALLSTTP
jgi:hypothetical protein